MSKVRFSTSISIFTPYVTTYEFRVPTSISDQDSGQTRARVFTNSLSEIRGSSGPGFFSDSGQTRAQNFSQIRGSSGPGFFSDSGQTWAQDFSEIRAQA